MKLTKEAIRNKKLIEKVKKKKVRCDICGKLIKTRKFKLL